MKALFEFLYTVALITLLAMYVSGFVFAYQLYLEHKENKHVGIGPILVILLFLSINIWSIYFTIKLFV